MKVTNHLVLEYLQYCFQEVSQSMDVMYIFPVMTFIKSRVNSIVYSLHQFFCWYFVVASSKVNYFNILSCIREPGKLVNYNTQMSYIRMLLFTCDVSVLDHSALRITDNIDAFSLKA